MQGGGKKKLMQYDGSHSFSIRGAAKERNED